MSTKENQLSNYGWDSTDPTHAHNYLWPAIKRLVGNHGQRLSILDIGCGNGYIAARFAEQGHEVTGLDVSPDGLSMARRAYANIRFEVASVYDDLSTLLGARFDLVVSSEVIEHLYFPRKLLSTAFNLLKPDCALILTTPYHGYLKNLMLSIFDKWDYHHTVGEDGGHIKFFSEHTLTKMLTENGFEEIEFSNAGRVPYLWKSMVCRAVRKTETI
ncbi:MAG: class I SAM-dependent methyltransferase [Gammaproteobacteria bacterium]